MSNANRPVRVLSVDGGGIYSIVPAFVLTEIERRTGQPIAKIFDVVTGASAGAMLGLAFLVPGRGGMPRYRGKEILTLYEEEAQHVFSTSLWRSLRTLGGLIEKKYDATGLDEVLGEVFGDIRLSESLADALVPAYEIAHDDPYVFRSHRGRNDPHDDFLMREVVRPTSAARRSFRPLRSRTWLMSGSRSSMAGSSPTARRSGAMARHTTSSGKTAISSLFL